MATMYEFLSMRPASGTPGKLKSTTEWEDPQIEARDYVIPVKNGQRTTISRTQKMTSRTTPRECDTVFRNDTDAANEKSTALVTQLVSHTFRSKAYLDHTDKESVSDRDHEDVAHHSTNDDEKSIGSSCLRPDATTAIDDLSDEEYIRILYDKKCEKCGLVPMGLFLRQIENEHLDLHFNAIGNMGMKSLAAPIAMCPSLVSINLNTTNIGDEGAFYLMEGLLSKEGIRDLDISSNSLTHKGGISICQLIKRSKSLRSLNLSGNNLGDKFAPSLAEALQETNLLAELNLMDTGLGLEGGKHIGPALGINDTVSDLNLSWNHIRLSGAVAISNGLKKNIGLLKLDVSWNGFSWDGSEALGEALSKNNTLTHLDISNNRIFDKAVFRLMKGIQKNQALEVLIVNTNPITLEGGLGILTSIEKNPSTNMQRVEMQGIPAKEPILQKIKDIQERFPDFEVIYEMTRDTAPKKTGMDLLFEYLHDNNKSLKDIFGLTEVSSELFMNTGAFTEQVMDAETPLTEAQIAEIANVLARKDGNVLALGYLFKRWEEFKEEQMTEH